MAVNALASTSCSANKILHSGKELLEVMPTAMHVTNDGGIKSILSEFSNGLARGC
jgi:hypothetical protein